MRSAGGGSFFSGVGKLATWNYEAVDQLYNGRRLPAKDEKETKKKNEKEIRKKNEKEIKKKNEKEIKKRIKKKQSKRMRKR